MHTNIIIIQNETDLAEAQALVSRLMDSDNPHEQARLQAQAILLQAYEAKRWPIERISR